MFNLLRAECYKLQRSKNLLGCALAIVGMCVMMYGMLVVADQILNGELANGTGGVFVGQSGDEIPFSLEEMGAMDMLQQLFAGNFMPIVMACFTSIVVAREYGSGAIKNIVGKGYSRPAIFLARFLTIVFGMAVLLLFGLAVSLAGALVVFGKGAFYAGIWKDVGIYMGLQFAICAAMGAVFVLVAEVGRGMAISITMSICVTLIPTLLFGGADMIFIRSDFKPSEYWLMNLCESCPVTGFEAGYIGKTLTVAAVWTVAALAAGVWHFKKADIK